MKNKLIGLDKGFWWKNPRGGKVVADPSQIDPSNIVMLFDGEKDLTTATWKEQITGDSMTLYNSPTISTLNNYPTVVFNGVDEYGKITTPVVARLNTTLYVVMNMVNYVFNKRIFDDGITNGYLTLRQIGTMDVLTSGNNLPLPKNLSNNKWVVMAIRIRSTAPNGVIKIYEDGVIYTKTGVLSITAVNLSGMTIGAEATASGKANSAFAYIMRRKVADDETTMDEIITECANRFAI